MLDGIKGKLAIVIPAFNEEESIESVILGVGLRGFPIVVDDGSVDQTGTVATTAGAHVVTHDSNQGYEAALESGIRAAQLLGFTCVITMDADGQHDPQLLDTFIREFDRGADLIVGRREKTQRWSEYLFCLAGSVFWGIYDPLCGMKGYRLELLDRINSIRTYDSIGTELAFRMVQLGAITSQPVIKIRPRNGQTRFGTGFFLNLRIIMAIVKSFRTLSFWKKFGF